MTGIVAATLGVCIGTLLAGLMDVVHPLDAVGSAFIDRTPSWLRELAIEWFDSNDKRALRVGMVIVMAAIAALVGVASLRHAWVGCAGIAAAGLLGAAAVADRPAEPTRAIAPPLVGAAIGIATLLGVLAVAEARWLVQRTPVRSRVPLGWDRRRFLAASGTAAAVAVVAGASAVQVERRRVRSLELSAPAQLPPVPPTASAPRPPAPGIAGATAFITPNDDFYRIDTALSFPRVDLDDWAVRIHGMVEREVSISYADLLAMPQVERMVTLACVSNPVGGDLVGNAVWQGVLLRDVLERAGVQPGAQQLFSRSLDGFTCGFPVAAALDERDCLIAIGMNGEPLPLAHGFPARLVVPGLYGYVSATKWLAEIELTTWEARTGYWISRGWSREGPIKTQSRIDVPRTGATIDAGPTPVAGVAWAQHRGIAQVEVRVDGGPWRPARLGDDATEDAWRQWVYEWDATPGEHTLQVRATDGTGETQTEVVSEPAPDGATGYHTRRVKVRG